MGYETFSQFYDQAMRDYTWCSEFLKIALPKSLPDDASILELGCGTGRILELVKERFGYACGLDLSEGMLTVARKRHPDMSFYHMDMVDFSLPDTFDTILCLFDSINHVAGFDDWTSIFRQVKKHLKKRGRFLLDINTPLRLQRLSILPPFITGTDNNGKIIMDIEEVNENAFVFHVEVFEPLGEELFRRHKIEIQEYTVDPYKVIDGLHNFFDQVDIYNEELHAVETGDLASSINGRMYFVCSCTTAKE